MRRAMAKKKSNKALALILMACAAAALLIGYRLLSAQNSGAPSDTAATNDVTMILERNASEVSALSYTFSGETLSFVCSGGVWSCKDDPSFPLDQTPVSQMAAAISSIGVYRTLDTGDTGEFGFDAPAAEITVSFSDDKTYRFAIGDQNPMSGNRYLIDRDSGTVYMISAALLSYFRYVQADLFLYDTLPSDIEAAYIDSARLLSDDAEKSLRVEEAETFFSVFQRLAPSEYADWHGDSETLSRYGIGHASLTVSYKRAVTITDTSGNENTTRVAASYTVRFGTVTEDGKIPYTIGDSAVVYLADAKLYDELNDCFD